MPRDEVRSPAALTRAGVPSAARTPEQRALGPEDVAERDPAAALVGLVGLHDHAAGLAPAQRRRAWIEMPLHRCGSARRGQARGGAIARALDGEVEEDLVAILRGVGPVAWLELSLRGFVREMKHECKDAPRTRKATHSRERVQRVVTATAVCVALSLSGWD